VRVKDHSQIVNFTLRIIGCHSFLLLLFSIIDRRLAFHINLALRFPIGLPASAPSLPRPHAASNLSLVELENFHHS
jgi:hypothetical protein